jgi:hypothetical protein
MRRRENSTAASTSKVMGDSLSNELSVLAYLILGTAVIGFLMYLALTKLGPPK